MIWSVAGGRKRYESQTDMGNHPGYVEVNVRSIKANGKPFNSKVRLRLDMCADPDFEARLQNPQYSTDDMQVDTDALAARWFDLIQVELQGTEPSYMPTHVPS